MKILKKITFLASAMVLLLAASFSVYAMEDVPGKTPTHHLEYEVRQIEDKIAQLVEEQAPDRQIEALQRDLSRAKKAWADSIENEFVFMDMPSTEDPNAQVVSQFNVYIHNTLTGSRFNIPLYVEFLEPGKPRNKLLEAGSTYKIGRITNLEPGSPIKLSGYGALKGYLVPEQTLSYDTLIQKWREVKQSDADPLFIIVGTHSSTPPYELSFNYSNIAVPLVPVMIAPVAPPGGGVPTNPFMVFDRLREKYPYLADELHNRERLKEANALVRETPFSELDRKLWQITLVPGSVWPWRDAKTAQDVARYILGLPQNYSNEDVKKAVRDLSLIWHPDKVPANQLEFATTVFHIIRTAEKLLNQALQDKKESAN